MTKDLEQRVLQLKAKGLSYSEISFFTNLLEDEAKEICLKREKEEQDRRHNEELDKEIEEATMKPWKRTKVM